MKYTVELAGRTLVVELEGGRINLDGRPVEARLAGSGAIRRLVRQGSTRVFVSTRGPAGEWRLVGSGHRLEVLALDRLDLAMGAAGTAGSGPRFAGRLAAPMPGLVVRVLVEPGQRVEADQGVLVLEAMKMENELRAAGSAAVRRVLVGPGDRVEKGTVLVEFE